jgi:hypothetical protein
MSFFINFFLYEYKALEEEEEEHARLSPRLSYRPKKRRDEDDDENRGTLFGSGVARAITPTQVSVYCLWSVVVWLSFGNNTISHHFLYSLHQM